MHKATMAEILPLYEINVILCMSVQFLPV